jgi:hypothetical protein
MQEMQWLNHLPEGTLEGGIALANRLYWNIVWAEHEHRWYVWSGERLILETDSADAAQAFLYGLGLAYAVLPEGTFERLEYLVKQWVAPETLLPTDEHGGELSS